MILILRAQCFTIFYDKLTQISEIGGTKSLHYTLFKNISKLSIRKKKKRKINESDEMIKCFVISVSYISGSLFLAKPLFIKTFMKNI